MGGCGAVWQRACFGSTGPQVQILSPAPMEGRRRKWPRGPWRPDMQGTVEATLAMSPAVRIRSPARVHKRRPSPRWVAPIRWMFLAASQGSSRTEHRPIVTVTRRRATPRSPKCEWAGAGPNRPRERKNRLVYQRKGESYGTEQCIAHHFSRIEEVEQRSDSAQFPAVQHDQRANNRWRYSRS